MRLAQAVALLQGGYNRSENVGLHKPLRDRDLMIDWDDDRYTPHAWDETNDSIAVGKTSVRADANKEQAISIKQPNVKSHG